MSTTKVSAAMQNAGAIVQVVNTQTGAVATGTTVMVGDDTIPQITEGDEYLTLAITPASTSNFLLVECVMNVTQSATATISIMGLFNTDVHATDAIAVVVYGTPGTGTNRPALMTLSYYLAAPVASATTFRIRIGGHQASTTALNASFGGTTRKMGGSYASTMTITEISA